MDEARRHYVPAAGHDWTLPLYDPLVKLLGGDRARRALIDQAALRPGQRVLEIGCGTGTLAVLVKRLEPEVEVLGLDPDPKALARAQRKAARAGVSIQFDRGFAEQLPYPEAAFDRVFSSFMFHHLQPEDREKTLREVRRVLQPGGGFHLLDFRTGNSGAIGVLARMIHTSDRLKANSVSRILTLMDRAGLTESTMVQEGNLLVFPIAYYRASASQPLR